MWPLNPETAIHLKDTKQESKWRSNIIAIACTKSFQGAFLVRFEDLHLGLRTGLLQHPCRSFELWLLFTRFIYISDITKSFV